MCKSNRTIHHYTSLHDPLERSLAYLIQERDRLTGVSGMHHRASYSHYEYVSQQKTYFSYQRAMNSEQVFIINDLRLLWGGEVRIFNLDWREGRAIA